MEISKRYFISVLLVSIGRQNFQELETMNVCAMKRKIKLNAMVEEQYLRELSCSMIIF
jgi:hypothetical protein